MSLTIIGLIVFISAIIIGVGILFVMWDKKKDTVRMPGRVICLIMIPVAAASLIFSISNYNNNARDSKQSCLAAGGYVYEPPNSDRKCFTEQPVELQKL